jgi:NADPH:quinone reductase-like Zn-dependent oxidoreductase
MAGEIVAVGSAVKKSAVGQRFCANFTLVETTFLQEILHPWMI